MSKLSLQFLKSNSFQHLLLSAFAAFVLLAPVLGHADLQFKKKVIEKCEEALSEVVALPISERVKYVEDLKIILTLNFSFEGLPTDAVKSTTVLNPLDPGVDEVKGAEIWKTFQPNRELNAKKCAVDILATMKPYSLDAIKELILLASDKSLPIDFVNKLNETIQSITISAASDLSYTVQPEVLDSLTGLLATPAAYKAQNALIELQKSAVPFLLSDIQKPDSARRDHITKALLNIDSSGQIIGQGVLNLLDSADDGLRKRAAALLAELEYLYNFSVPALIGKLNDLSPEVENAVFAALNDIFDSKSFSGQLVLEPEKLEILVKSYEFSKPENREILIKGLKKLGPVVPGFQEMLLKTLSINNILLKESTIEIVGNISKPSPELSKILFDALYDSNLNTRLKAIEALANHHNPKEVIAAYTKLLKSVSAEKDPDVKHLLTLEVAKSVSKINAGTTATPLIPYFVQAVQAGSSFFERKLSILYATNLQVENINISGSLGSNYAVAALVNIGQGAVPAIIKGLSNKDPLVKQRLAYALGNIKPPNETAIKALVGLLNDGNTETRTIVENILVSIGQPAIPQVQVLYTRGSKTTKYVAAKILLALGVKDKKVVETLIEQYKKETCSGKSVLAINYPSLKDSQSFNVASALIECLTKEQFNSEQISKALVAIAPVGSKELDSILEAIKSGTLSKKAQISIIENARALGFADSQVVSLITESLNTPDKSVQLRLITILQDYSTEAKMSLPLLLEFINKNSSDQLLVHEMIVTVNKIDPTAFDSTSFLSDQLGKDTYQWAQKSLTKIDSATTLTVLTKALRDLKLHEKSRALEVAGGMQEKAQSLVPDILELTKSQSPDLAYSATIALLKIEPSNPAAAIALKRQLISDYGERIVKEEFYPSARPLFESIFAETSSLAEKKMLHRMLSNLPENSTEPLK